MTLTRAITALIGIPLLVYLIEFAPLPVFAGVTIIASLVMLYEYFALTGDKRSKAVHASAYLLTFLILISSYLPDPAIRILLPAGGMLVLVVALVSRIPVGDSLQSTAYALFGSWYIGGLMGFLISLRMIHEGGETGADLAMMLFVIIWAADIAGFVFGKTLGKHQLTVVSPKKTVEGAIAGFVFSIAAAVGCQALFVQQLPWQHAAAMGTLVGITGQLGDICESLLKRAVSVKDSGTLLPGHGGMLDRLDSLLFGAPTMYYYFYFVLQK